MNELSDWLNELQPPPGGQQRLRARLDRRRNARWSLPVVALLAVASSLCLFAVINRSRVASLDLGLDLLAPQDSVVLAPGREVDMALMRVPSEVVFYRIASAKSPQVLELP